MAKDAGFWYRNIDRPEKPVLQRRRGSGTGFLHTAEVGRNDPNAWGLGSTRKDDRRLLYMSRESDKNFRVSFP
jgi:hypothetical protein